MSLSTILKILASCFICHSDSSCGTKEDSNSVKQNYKKRKKKNEEKESFTDEDDLYML